jgi:proline iminopeptidase
MNVIKAGYLAVGEGHNVWFNFVGNASAKTPIVFLHGGPGGNISDRHMSHFDLEQQKVIFLISEDAARVPL